MNLPQFELLAKIREIQNDASLTEKEKARKRQELLSGKWVAKSSEDENKEPNKGSEGSSEAAVPAKHDRGSSMLDETLQCAFCCNLCERPVTAPCQHNFCLKCFQKWVGTGKKTCPTCRSSFPASFASNPRINTALTVAIRMAKLGEERSNAQAKHYSRVEDKDRPDEAFVTERAKRNGRANASSGRIMVKIPNDHFGPIPAEADPRRQGIRVGEWWKDRLDCRQWGVHFPHVAGIAGQCTVGAQSVVLSGGYEDDRDEGEWFLYTGSGGRDLSGNKRTTKVQSFDQKFESMNAALKLSCIKGLPVRVVRSYKEKRSSYAPTTDTPVRYDGIYRIIKCWRKPGAQGFLICRYLFVRCDNEPAPWSSEETGDKPDFELPKEALAELADAKGSVFEMSSEPWWGWKEEDGKWGWNRDPPASQKTGGGGSGERKARPKVSEAKRALAEFMCKLCKTTLSDPICTPCGHNFCKSCVDKQFAGLGDEQEVASGRSLRVRKMIKPCPSCKADIADFLKTAQVNREMAALIKQLQSKVATELAAAKAHTDAQAAAGEDGDAEDVDAAEEVDDGDESEDAEALATVATMAEGAEEAEEAADTAGLTDKPIVQAQEGAIGAAAAAPTAAADEAAELDVKIAQLLEEFPEYDRELIAGMLDDQAGDMDDVRFYLKKMRNQLKNANRKLKQSTAKSSQQSAALKRKADHHVDQAEEHAAEGAEQAGKPAMQNGSNDKDMATAASDDEQEEEQAEDTGGEPAAGAKLQKPVAKKSRKA